MRFAIGLLGSALSFCLVTSAQAQSFNIDINSTAGLVPSSAFGAAAGQAGVWNSVDGGVTPQALVDLSGNATGVTWTSAFSNGIFASLTNLPGADTETVNLLTDVLDLETPGNSDTFTIAGLQNGTYEVYTYAMAPDSGDFRTDVNVNGTGVQTVGGAFTGSFVLGVTHSMHTVTVTDGIITINTSVPTIAGITNFGSLAGVQLVLVPGPGALALLGIAGLAGSRRRRRG